MNRRRATTPRPSTRPGSARAHPPGAVGRRGRRARRAAPSSSAKPPSPSRRAEFRDSLRTQLMTEAETRSRARGHANRPAAPAAAAHAVVRLPPSPRRRHRRVGHRRRLRRLVGASAEALPGEMLYPVKRGVENVELAFHKDDASRGCSAWRRPPSVSPRHATSATTAAAVERAHRRRARRLRRTGRTTAPAHCSATTATTVVSSPSPQVNDFSAAAAADLAQLSGQVPVDADQSFQAAAATVSELVTQASRLCTSCGTADVTGLVGAMSFTERRQRTTTRGRPPTRPRQRTAAPDVPVEKSVVPDTPKITIPDCRPSSRPRRPRRPLRTPARVQEAHRPPRGRHSSATTSSRASSRTCSTVCRRRR